MCSVPKKKTSPPWIYSATTNLPVSGLFGAPLGAAPLTTQKLKKEKKTEVEPTHLDNAESDFGWNQRSHNSTFLILFLELEFSGKASKQGS